MGNQSIRFDIEVTFKRSRYKATSPTFPQCSGSGKSEEEAIDALTKSISKRIANNAQEALTQIRKRDCLASEPILDAKNKPLGIRKSYELDAGAFGRPQRQVTRLSYPSRPDHYKVPIEHDIRRLFGAFETDFTALPDFDSSDDEPGLQGPVFGFPLSLN